MAQQHQRQDDALLQGMGTSGVLSLPVVDAEEARIFRQSLPADGVTRDFLEDLLQEYRATRTSGTG